MSTPNLSALVAELKEDADDLRRWDKELTDQYPGPISLGDLPHIADHIEALLAAFQPDRERTEKNEKLAVKLDGLPQLLKDGFGVKVGDNEVWMREAAAALRAPSPAGLDLDNGTLRSALEGMVSLFPERPADDGTPGSPWANHVTEKYDAAVRALKECNALSPAPAGDEEFKDWEVRHLVKRMRHRADELRLISEDVPSIPLLEKAAALLSQPSPSAPVRIDPERPETWPPRDNSILDWPISIMVRAAYHQHGSWVEQNIRWDYELKHWQGGWPATHWQPLPEWPKEGER